MVGDLVGVSSLSDLDPGVTGVTRQIGVDLISPRIHLEVLAHVTSGHHDTDGALLAVGVARLGLRRAEEMQRAGGAVVWARSTVRQRKRVPLPTVVVAKQRAHMVGGTLGMRDSVCIGHLVGDIRTGKRVHRLHIHTRGRCATCVAQRQREDLVFERTHEGVSPDRLCTIRGDRQHVDPDRVHVSRRENRVAAHIVFGQEDRLHGGTLIDREIERLTYCL
mmetsp:Transcript_25321/g.63493  ORF Transcript_25321/g.63493 Transcript_25321/m.63493 type:complete len:220 (-) Transcript_25321:1073-1732(-)